jgi:hypothetical protein
MANPDKKVVSGRVQKENNRRFKIQKDRPTEVDIEIDVLQEGDYHVDKLETDGLPESMPDGNAIHWFNNFSIKKNGSYINQRYRVRITGISSMAPSKLVIFNGNGELYYYEGIIDKDDTFELTDGDPGVGGAPP